MRKTYQQNPANRASSDLWRKQKLACRDCLRHRYHDRPQEQADQQQCSNCQCKRWVLECKNDACNLQAN